MSRFYMTDSYIPQVERMLKAGASNQEIAEATGFTKRTVIDFIAKHKLRAKEPRKLPSS
jgi:DNA invertase Pin-like site-specific DNA recombinase